MLLILYAKKLKWVAKYSSYIHNYKNVQEMILSQVYKIYNSVGSLDCSQGALLIGAFMSSLDSLFLVAPYNQAYVNWVNIN